MKFHVYTIKYNIWRIRFKSNVVYATIYKLSLIDRLHLKCWLKITMLFILKDFVWLKSNDILSYSSCNFFLYQSFPYFSITTSSQNKNKFTKPTTTFTKRHFSFQLLKSQKFSNSKQNFSSPSGRSFHISYFTQCATAFYTLANTAYRDILFT